MRNYTLAALLSSLLGWLAGVVAYWVGSFWLSRNQLYGAPGDMALLTLPVSLLANVVFLQLPRYAVKKAFGKVGRLGFALAYAALAYLTLHLIFSLVVKSLFAELEILNVIVNGLVLGYAFRASWKPA